MTGKVRFTVLVPANLMSRIHASLCTNEFGEEENLQDFFKRAVLNEVIKRTDVTQSGDKSAAQPLPPRRPRESSTPSEGSIPKRNRETGKVTWVDPNPDD